ncbi:hypothetical protein [Candidatus Poriferisocius sp.]|uniref:hypothetical protein n=1 Tax=Candidatus Poriferisocius sp. TaxID=3101276 RepID=UPI003B599D03
MAAVEVVRGAALAASATYPVATVEVTGDYSARLVSPQGASLWLVAADLGQGTVLGWDEHHGDEAVYVRRGELAVSGTTGPRICPADGAIVVEAGVHAVAVAGPNTSIVHVGPTDPTPPTGGLRGPARARDRSVRVVGPGGMWATVNDHQRTRFFSDASDPTNRLWLLATERFGRFESSAHSHSQDELIHVLRGEIRIGRRRVGVGDTLWVASDRRYRLVSGEEGMCFLNYRRDASMMTSPTYDEPLLEAGESTGMAMVGDCR